MPGMISAMNSLKSCLDAVCGVLSPLLPLANQHMVNFFSQSQHWLDGVPASLHDDLQRIAARDDDDNEEKDLLELYFSLDSLNGEDMGKIAIYRIGTVGYEKIGASVTCDLARVS